MSEPLPDPLATFSLAGEVALVTGASRGLGARFARVLAGAGAKVVLAARKRESVEAGAEAIQSAGGEAAAVALDVTDEASVRAGFDAAEAAFGTVGVLINNAGISVSGRALEQSLDDWQSVLDTNLTGAWLVAREAARRLIAAGRPGAVVNLASIFGLTASGEIGSYLATKAALVNLTRGLALEWARHGIRVNALAPGYIVTDFNREFLEGPAGEGIRKRVPQRRFGTPQDLDGPLLLLCSGASAHMTGTALVVDGGHTARL